MTLGTLTAPTGQTLPRGVSLGTATASGTIRDADELTVNLEDDKETVPDNADAMFTLRLEGGTGKANITVHYEYRVGSERESDTETITAGAGYGNNYDSAG